jgi:hypothetical protein
MSKSYGNLIMQKAIRADSEALGTQFQRIRKRLTKTF